MSKPHGASLTCKIISNGSPQLDKKMLQTIESAIWENCKTEKLQSVWDPNDVVS